MTMMILLNNLPFILREPQDERRSGGNHWNFSVHAEPSRSIHRVFQQSLMITLNPNNSALLLRSRSLDNKSWREPRKSCIG